MPIPNPVVRDVEDIIGEGLGKRRHRARRMAATLRRAGYEPAAVWIETNVQEYEDNKLAQIDGDGVRD